MKKLLIGLLGLLSLYGLASATTNLVSPVGGQVVGSGVSFTRTTDVSNVSGISLTVSKEGEEDLIVTGYQSTELASSMDGNNNYFRDIKTDNEGNLYVAGTFSSSSIDFGSITLFGSGNGDIFVAKMNSQGNRERAKSFGGTGQDDLDWFEMSPDGGMYVKGSFNSPSITFDGNTISNYSTDGNSDCYITRFALDGTIEWAVGISGNESERFYNYVFDEMGNLYIAGMFSSSTIILGEINLNNIGNSYVADIVVAKLSNTGNWERAKSAGDNSPDNNGHPNISQIKIDYLGNVYIAGYYPNHGMIFGSTTLANIGGTDIFVAKMSNTGEWDWAKNAGGIGQEQEPYLMNIDNEGNVYLGGFYGSQTTNFGGIQLINSSDYDMYVSKLNNLGERQWAKSLGGIGNNYGGYFSSDTGGNIYLFSSFSSSEINFGGTILTNNGGNDTFIAKINSGGNREWQKNIGGTGGDYPSLMLLDSAGSIYIAGNYEFPNIDLGEGFIIDTGNSYLAKLNGQGAREWLKTSLSRNINGYGDGMNFDNDGNLYLLGSFYLPDISFGDITLDGNENGSILFVSIDQNGNWLSAKTRNVLYSAGSKFILDNQNNPYVITQWTNDETRTEMFSSIRTPNKVFSYTDNIVLNPGFYSRNVDIFGDITESSITETFEVEDTEAPIITGVISGGIYTGSARFTVTDNVGVSGVILDGIELTGWTNYVVTASGSHTIVARDTSLNEIIIDFQVNFVESDTEAPIIIGVVASGTYIGSATFTVTDNVGVSGVTLDGLELTGWTNYVVTASGSHIVVARDSTGNQNMINFQIIPEKKVSVINMDPFFDSGIPVGFPDTVNTIAKQKDGKILVGGDFWSYKGQSIPGLVRLYLDGSVDTTFNPGEFDNIIMSIFVQEDGKILVGGYFTTYNGEPANGLVRLNSDGSRDRGFDIGSGFYHSSPYSIVTQSDGKILVGGDFIKYNGIPTTGLIRLNVDGSMDAGFDLSSGFNYAVWKILLDKDGKILVGGTFTKYDGVPTTGLVRLNNDGSRDTGFAIDSSLNYEVWGLVEQKDGKILVGGYDMGTSNGLVRLNNDGSLDTNFVIDGYVYSVLLQEDGKILAGGDSNLIRFNTDGTRDNTFGSNVGFDRRFLSMVLQDDGKILVGGDFKTYDNVATNRIVRLNTDGTKDETFNNGYGFDDNVEDFDIQDDGKIVAIGNFINYKGIRVNRIVRLLKGGRLDTSFDAGSGFNRVGESIVIDSNGKILVGGSFTTYQGVSANRIVRLNSDGTRDTEFNIGSGFNGTVDKIKIDSNGKILVGGSFTTYQGVSVNRIVRLNTDGTRDMGFNSSIYSVVNNFVEQDDGKIVVVGTDAYRSIHRLNTDGSIDTGFNVDMCPADSCNGGRINAIGLQEDGKIIIGGLFYPKDANGRSMQGLVRLTTTGVIDPGFNLGGYGLTIAADVIHIQEDGKILVGGMFDRYNGESAQGLLRLFPDGTRDKLFNVGSGFNDRVRSIKIDDDGKIVVGGIFTTYAGKAAGYLVRLLGDTDLVVIPDSTNINMVESEFTDKGYIKEGNKLVGTKAISLMLVDGEIPVDLNLENEGIKLSITSGTQFVRDEDNSNYDGVITVPVQSIGINSILDKDILSVFNVGNTSESTMLQGGQATLTVPVIDKGIGDVVYIYYAQDNGVNRYPKTMSNVKEIGGEQVVQFDTDQLSSFSILEAGKILNINNGEVSTTGQIVKLSILIDIPVENMRFSNDGSNRSEREEFSSNKTRSLSNGGGEKIVYMQLDIDGNNLMDVQTSDNILYVSDTTETNTGTDNNGGGGGGGIKLEKDECEGVDCSDSYYDEMCARPEVHSSAPTCEVPNTGDYSAEKIHAFQRAYSRGITTMCPIEDANLDSEITREQMAKMVSNYMIKVIGNTGTIRTANECDNFDDLNDMSDEMKGYAVVSCQLGLMGQDGKGGLIQSFYPEAKVTRAQFGTILSRMLRGDKYNQAGLEWYRLHLEALKEDGVMTKIENPYRKELRGRVMIMMDRASLKIQSR